MPMSKVAILVVEDLPHVRATAVQIMEGFGYTVLDAYNGHQAIKLLQAHPEIEVLFADIRMPGMSGTELAEVAQRLRPDLKIVLTSGYVSQKDVGLRSQLHQWGLVTASAMGATRQGFGTKVTSAGTSFGPT